MNNMHFFQITARTNSLMIPICEADAPTLSHSIWAANLFHDPSEQVDCLLIQEIGSNRYLAFETCRNICVEYVLHVFQELERFMGLPTTIIARGALFASPGFMDWAACANVSIRMASPTPLRLGFKHERLQVVELPDLGRAVARTRPTSEMYFFNLPMHGFTIVDDSTCTTTCIHPWDGRAHTVHFEFSWEILRDMLKALPEATRSEVVNSLRDRPAPVEGTLPIPILLQVVECFLPKRSVISSTATVVFEISQVKVSHSTDHAPARRQKLRSVTRSHGLSERQSNTLSPSDSD